ncbi:DUF397 domain-containing protein [Actinoplanes sp. TFC3]|uniref:DUF397 domain-containing protein n=1 Tax=Actinoplanes sp. TFC3 TaxID=1710355 RepID=UPI000AC326B4|nr:DUF397 domain-containing protein [Actinoplanes sp. TFC3]
MTEIPDHISWQRSRHCSDVGCAEVAVSDEAVHLRSSQEPDRVLTFTPAEWEAFKRGVLDGQF